MFWVSGAQAGQLLTGTVRVQGQPVAQAIVYLETAAQPSPLPPPPPLLLETVDGRLQPRLQLGRTGAALRLRNHEPTLRIVQIEQLSATNPPQRLLIEAMPYAGFDKTVPLKTDQPAALLRARAGNATAYLALLPHPWAAITDTAGRFTLTHVAAGQHRLHVWHELRGATAWSVNVTSGRTAAVSIDLTPSR